MNVFHKIALQGLRESRTRTLVTITGVVLSAALLTGVTTFGISLLDYMAKGAAEKYGGWHAAFFDVTNDFIKEQSQDADVLDAVTTENLGYAALSDSKNPDKPYLFLSGYSSKAFEQLPFLILSGRLPENDSEIIVTAGAQSESGEALTEGSTVTLALGERTLNGQILGQHDRFDPSETFTPRETRTFTIVGLCQRPQYEPRSAPGFTLITRTGRTPMASDLYRQPEQNNAPASAMFAKEDRTLEASNYNVFVTLDIPYKIGAYLKRTTGARFSSRNDSVLRFMGLSDDKLFTSLLLAVGGIVVAIIMVGSIFLIHNAFQISLNERTHQLGILLSIGATARQLHGMVLFEGLCIGLAGIPLGMLVGLAAIRGVIAIVARSFQGIMYNTPLVPVLSPPALAASAGIALVTILISAYLPAKKAVAVPVMDCIRQTGEIKVEAKAVRVSRLTERLFALEGMLALKNFKRSKRRYRSIVLSLALSVILFVSTNAFVGCLGQASEAAVVFTDIDLALSAPQMEDDKLLSLYDRLKNVSGVTSGGYQEVRQYECTIPAELQSDALREVLVESAAEPFILQIQFLDEERWRALVEKTGLHAEDFTGPDAPLFCVAKIDVSANRMSEPEEVPDMFTVPALDIALGGSDGKPVTLQCESFIPYDVVAEDLSGTASLPYSFFAEVPWSKKAEFDALEGVSSGKGLTFQSEDPNTSEAEMREILSGNPPKVKYTLYNMSSMMSQNTNMIFIANVFAYTFTIMISLIAAANVFNTISTNIRLRRRELAMLRSIGMAERDFMKMMCFECALYGTKALLYGLPLSTLLSCLIYVGFWQGGADEIDFFLPWDAMCISTIGVLLIVLVTMLYAVNKIRKENIIDALRDDVN